MATKSKDNPTSSTILQVLLDLKTHGYDDMSIGDFIDVLSADKDLLKTLDASWAHRMYSDKSITWASLTITPGLMKISPEALKILVLMGMYADQTSLIMVKRNVIVQATGIKLTKTKEALRELEECGAIKIQVPQRGQKAPIYLVNGNIICVGRRNKKFTFDGDVDNYILRQQEILSGMKLVAARRTDPQPDGTKLMYHELDFMPDNEKEPLDASKTSKSSRKSSKRDSSKSETKGQPDDNVEGQLAFDLDGRISTV